MDRRRFIRSSVTGAAGGVLMPAVIPAWPFGEGSRSCNPFNLQTGKMKNNTVKLIQLNPGHFHASLVQKFMYEQVDPQVHVYAPEGPDVQDYLDRIGVYNQRVDQPTSWETRLYTGEDYLQRMLDEKPGNLMVTAGNNARKTDCIKQAVEAGLNVFADKPMVINPDQFPLLVEAFRIAGQRNVLLYDIMTERYEITTILQRELSMIPEVFGELQTGSEDEPAITKESVHHLFKYVSGNPVRRPGWFFDVDQQGTGLADVGTHLVDLVQWECFPEQIIDYVSDIEMISAKSWPTVLDAGQFEKVTGLSAYPRYLEPYLEGDRLSYPCNGKMLYRIKGIHAMVSVVWNFQAPEGTGDTHYSVMRGGTCNLIIRQGEQEGYHPVLHVEPAGDPADFRRKLEKAVEGIIAVKYPGVALEQIDGRRWRLNIPDQYKVGHEAHFAQVMGKYLGFLEKGRMPEWEVPNMIAKYYTTTRSAVMSE